MKPTLLTPILLALALASTGVVCAETLEEKKARDLAAAQDPYAPPPESNQYVTVYPPFGVYYHQVDHLQVYGTENVVAAAAINQGYIPCPLCGPPSTNGALTSSPEEAKKVQDRLATEFNAGKRNIPYYYATLLQARVKALSDVVPPGLSGGAGPTGGTARGNQGRPAAQQQGPTTSNR